MCFFLHPSKLTEYIILVFNASITLIADTQLKILIYQVNYHSLPLYTRTELLVYEFNSVRNIRVFAISLL